MKRLAFGILACFPFFAVAQVAINNDNSSPDTTAMLDVKSNSKGMLIPRLTMQERISIINPATGLLIYQRDTLNGFYFNAGLPSLPNWRSVSTNESAWSTNGNIVSSSNYFGTTNNAALLFRINNQPAGMLDPVNQNIALGVSSLSSNITGIKNIAIGWGALSNNTAGLFLVAIGDSALHNQTSSFAYFNTAIGAKALLKNTIGFENTAVGFAALASNTIGNDNTGVGDGALRLNTSGQVNTAVGLHALYGNLEGLYNTGMGAFAMQKNTTGSMNTALGAYADADSVNLTNATAIGYNTKVDASNKVRVGNTFVTSIGGQVGWTTFSDGRYKILVREDVPGMKFINKLRPVTYEVDVAALNQHYKSGNNLHAKNTASRQSGFIAQEVETIAKEMQYDFSGVDKPSNVNALYGLRYADFVVPMIKGMQQQDAVIQKQQAEINDLNEKLTKMQTTIDRLVMNSK